MLRVFAVGIATTLACGDPGRGTDVPSGSTGQLITIRNYEFFPRSLNVVPGSVVLVRNEDPVVHTVTSETAPGQYTAGAVDGISFDTGPFTGSRAISIPANAPPGTVVPYFCAIHGAAMLNEGELVITPP